ncbi:MAG TPA: NTPase [Geobacteraceae bacterium]|nr:NTPase [Geobacteraceae bacterium]
MPEDALGRPLHQALLSLGSNIEPERNLPAAVRELARYGRVVRLSSVWESPAEGAPGTPDFLNASLWLETPLSALELKEGAIAAVEARLGRVRAADRNAPRTIDIDIMLFDQDRLDLGRRRIPDPEVCERPFVAIPLAEIAPDYHHPETGESLAEIAARFEPAACGMRRRDDVRLTGAGKRHLLITGRPGSGKTTLLVRLARELTDLKPAGFYTEEIREEGERRGFRLTGLDGREGVLAHVAFRGAYRVGRYGVDVAGFEAFLGALALAASPSRLILIDEIGRMECLSSRFRELVRELLDSGKTVVATVARQGAGLIAAVKEREECELVEVTPGNRERLVEELAKRIRNDLAAEKA